MIVYRKEYKIIVRRTGLEENRNGNLTEWFSDRMKEYKEQQRQQQSQEE